MRIIDHWERNSLYYQQRTTRNGFNAESKKTTTVVDMVCI